MAREAEGAGFDGLSFGDTQGLAADPYVGLALAARVTSMLLLGVRVTNPVTREFLPTESLILFAADLAFSGSLDPITTS